MAIILEKLNQNDDYMPFLPFYTVYDALHIMCITLYPSLSVIFRDTLNKALAVVESST